MSKSKPVLQSAAAVWDALQAQGGLEPNGRDREFVDKIVGMLDPMATDIAAALINVSTDRLIQCFFQSMQQFTEMFRDVLNYYKLAGANRGRQQLNISIEEQHFEFKDFEDFIQLWNEVPGEIEVPMVDHGTMSVHRLAWEAVPPLTNMAFDVVRGRAETGDMEVDAWLENYRTGHLVAPPPSLWAAQQVEGFKELAAIGIAATEALRNRCSAPTFPAVA